MAITYRGPGKTRMQVQNISEIKKALILLLVHNQLKLTVWCILKQHQEGRTLPLYRLHLYISTMQHHDLLAEA
jgi:hypothetical protein